MKFHSTFLLSILFPAIFWVAISSFAKEIQTLAIGEKAPDFKLPGIDGKAYRLSDFNNAKVLAFIFTANHCPTAQAYEDRIIQLSSDYQDKAVAIVAISPNDPLAVRLDELGYTDLSDSFDELKIRAAEKNFNFPYLYDGETQKMSEAYGPVSTPHAFVFDENRKLIYTGRIDDSENPANITSYDLRNAIDAVLAGKPVAVAQTKTFGCSIKWADKRESVKQAFASWSQETVNVRKIDLAAIEKLMKNDTEKLLMINFWATWCGPCVAEFPVLVEMNRMYRNRDFELITISLDKPDKTDQALKFLKKFEASATNYHFDSENVYDLIDIVDKEWPGAIPFTVLVKPGGEIISRHLGLIDKPLEIKKKIVEHIGRYYF